ncbi:hypothetical protein [Nocardioides speluncae]|uniref:hypothetical protein n=1 Tax=Nocardioides speluncae TaxID=2670337 RepID=UPI001474B0E3|nr:hypothetical protein [Nocardioides speluncae]
MTATTTSPSVTVSRQSLVDAARALLRAARFADALALLDGAASDHPEVALARAEVALTSGYLGGSADVDAELAAAEAAVAGCDDPGVTWDAEFLRLRQRYTREIFDAHTVLGSAEGRDPARIGALRRTAEGLRDRAPDVRRRGWAEFYLGTIADNVYGDRAAGPAHLTAALAVGKEAADDLLCFEALRHLGDHAHDEGDAVLALDQWQRSTEYAARAGSITGTLAQQILLAQLARERGDEHGARLLAAEVARWAGAVGADRTRAHAEAFAAGADPTSPDATNAEG